jgi:hypothetical protein
MSPIPKKLLNDVIRIDGEEFEFVRVEQIDKLTSTAYGAIVEGDCLIFIDKVNTPRFDRLAELLEEKRTIEYKNRYRNVIQVDVLKAQAEIHHLEVYMR